MSDAPGYRRTLRRFDLTLLVAGTMIGSGVFVVSPDMVRTGHTGGFLMAAWVLSALLTLAGALSFGELSARLPRAGGQYAFLREAYGPGTGFTYGWALFAIIQCGSLAAVGTALGNTLGLLLPGLSESNWVVGPWKVPALALGHGMELGPYALGLTTSRLLGVAAILGLTALQARGVKLGSRVQNGFSLLNLGALAVLVMLGWTMRPSAPAQGPLPGAPAMPWLAALLVVQTGSLFAMDGWCYTTFLSEESEDPARDIPRALFLGTALVCGLYLLIQGAYLRVLGPGGLAAAPGDNAGSATLSALLGPSGAWIMALAVGLAMTGCLNALILTGARVFQAMAADGLFLKAAEPLNGHGVPARSLWLQAAWSCLLALSGTFGQLLEAVMFSQLLFYALTVGALFILRRRDGEGPVRTPGYPLVPLLYLAGMLAIMGALLRWRPAYTWPGLGLVLLGLPVYFARYSARSPWKWWRPFSRRTE